MITVYVKKQSGFPIDSARIKKELKIFFTENGIVSNAQVEVAIVGKTKMIELAKAYLKEKDIIHNVLSFPASEIKGKFKYPPGAPIDLGQIVVCYPQAVSEANKEGKLVDDKISELVIHAGYHLLGIHHD
jgi:probable rRNA maturation factor